MGNSAVELSEKQKEIINSKGKVVINACPGSGKTFSVAARIAHLVSSRTFYHQGIAAISFTNTAWQEIENKLRDDFNIDVPIRYPHFLGTIDSFLNKYVFLPYGHLRLNTKERPQLVGEPHSVWTGRGYYDSFFDKISFNKRGLNYIYQGTFIPPEIRDEVFDMKSKILKKGFANQSDANFISMRVLMKYPLIAKNIAIRFPYLLVDEAQDTTDVQMAIIDLLKVHINEIMLIGDPDQAIFEWNNAKPELFKGKIKEWTEIKLSENRRSSREICNCANAFIGEEKSIPFEGSLVKGYDYMPKILEYANKSNIDEIKDDFLKLCKLHEIEEKNIAIIYRSKIFGNHLGNPLFKQGCYPWIDGKLFVRDIVHGKFLFENNDIKKGFKYIERGFYKATTGSSYLTNDFFKNEILKKGLVNYRKEIFDFIDLLPDCKDKQLSEWVKEALVAIKGIYSFDLPVKKIISKTRIYSLFENPELQKNEYDYHTGTIHSVKGETYDAVLLFLNDASGCRTLYSNILKKSETQLKDKEREELRIVYVGLTRARKILVLAVPEGCKDIWSEKLKLK